MSDAFEHDFDAMIELALAGELEGDALRQFEALCTQDDYRERWERARQAEARMDVALGRLESQHAPAGLSAKIMAAWDAELAGEAQPEPEPEQTTLWQRLSGWLTLPQVQWAGAMALVAIIAVQVLFVMQDRSSVDPAITRSPATQQVAKRIAPATKGIEGARDEAMTSPARKSVASSPRELASVLPEDMEERPESNTEHDNAFFALAEPSPEVSGAQPVEEEIFIAAGDAEENESRLTFEFDAPDSNLDLEMNESRDDATVMLSEAMPAAPDESEAEDASKTLHAFRVDVIDLNDDLAEEIEESYDGTIVLAYGWSGSAFAGSSSAQRPAVSRNKVGSVERALHDGGTTARSTATDEKQVLREVEMKIAACGGEILERKKVSKPQPGWELTLEMDAPALACWLEAMAEDGIALPDEGPLKKTLDAKKSEPDAKAQGNAGQLRVLEGERSLAQLLKDKPTAGASRPDATNRLPIDTIKKRGDADSEEAKTSQKRLIRLTIRQIP